MHRFKVLHFLPSSYLNRICLKVYFCQQPMLTSLIHLLLTRAIFQISVSRISCAILAIGLCLCFVLIFHLYQLKFQSTSTADTNAKHSAESKLHCVSCHTRGKKWDSGEEFTRSRLPDLAAAHSGTRHFSHISHFLTPPVWPSGLPHAFFHCPPSCGEFLPRLLGITNNFSHNQMWLLLFQTLFVLCIFWGAFIWLSLIWQ